MVKDSSKKIQHFSIVEHDPYLEPYELTILARHKYALEKISQLTAHRTASLRDFSQGYKYYGLHKTDSGWVFREKAPNATAIYLLGDFNNWTESEEFRLHPVSSVESSSHQGEWELWMPSHAIKHGDNYKLHVYWKDGMGERIPAWANRVVQNEETALFCAQVWQPHTPYQFQVAEFKPNRSPLFIYECHIGMALDKEGIGTYNEFRTQILPRIKSEGYNCIQLMAIQEHPYYGSFGYHVSSFFAPSSRFGTPDELKQLIDEAHLMGMAVIMDLVHSHSVKNEAEGLGNFAGDPEQYFCPLPRRIHQQWDSLCFDYGKNDVLHFLLSNCHYWIEEYHFDGFRFDGVTSMLYYNHGLGQAFVSYDDYFANGAQDGDAICYLMLANKLIHEINPNAITIAEDVSGMPGIAASFESGGLGFDYRLAMNVPDFWIKMIKEEQDEDWKPSQLFWEMTNRRYDELTVSYAESHDQALVGDKTIIFRLVDSDMYWHFQKGDETLCVERGIALHKMIRLLTCSTHGGAYLNFMGNEWGHPEWIDFPREGNNWSYKYARRQWSLLDNLALFFHCLGEFDKKMLEIISDMSSQQVPPIELVTAHDADQVLAYKRDDFLFVYNFNPIQYFENYGLKVPGGQYELQLDSALKNYGGYKDAEETPVIIETQSNEEADSKEWLRLCLPPRTAMVFKVKK